MAEESPATIRQRASSPRVHAPGRAKAVPAAELCRSLAEGLGVDTVGVALVDSERRSHAWWTAPGSAPLPLRIEDIVEGREKGWVVGMVEGGAVFARLGPSSSVRTAEIVKEAAASLVAALGEGMGVLGVAVERPLAAPLFAEEQDQAVADGARRALPIARAVARAISDPAAELATVLEAARDALDAHDIFLLIERDDGIEVTSPAGEAPRQVPPEIGATLRALRRDQPIADATARRLGVVLRAKSPSAAAAFCNDSEPLSVLVAVWNQEAEPCGTDVRAAAAIVGVALAALGRGERNASDLLSHERTRLAYELHDGLTQIVTSAVLELEALGGSIEHGTGTAEALTSAKDEMRRALADLRSVLFDLSEPGRATDRRSEPLTSGLADLAGRWEVPVDVSVEGELADVPRAVLAAAYVVAREGLANAAKHAATPIVNVRIRAEAAELRVEVEDHGKGFLPSEEAATNGHLGLRIMRERVSEAGGTLDVESSPGEGTRVVARLPVGHGGDTS